MSIKSYAPSDIHPPLGSYTHAVEIPAGMRLLTLAGQIGIKPDGTLADGIEAQLRQSWANITAILKAAGMTMTDIVKVTTYLVRPQDFAAHRQIRAEVLGDHRPPSTLLCISQLASPDMLCEIEVMAAAK